MNRAAKLGGIPAALGPEVSKPWDLGSGRDLERLAATYLAILAASGISVHLFLRYAWRVSPHLASTPLYVVLLLGGTPLLFMLGRRLLALEFGSDLLAGVSIATAVILGQYLVASIVVLMLSGGTALEAFATRRASSVLVALAKRMPQVAHCRTGQGITDTRLEDVAIGDTLLVLPHEICPVDGVVLEGQGKMNEAYLTGEPFEMSKTPGSTVISGALNGETALTIRAEKLAIDSRYARIMRVMEETQQRRPRLRRLGDTLGAWYTPLALTVAILAWVASGQASRFLAVVVIATPCPLLIAIPVAVIGAISLSARRGIIIKNPAVLEQIDSCRTFIFDKTGTLTYGRPSLIEVLCAPGFTEDQVLAAAASLEIYSKHPLARPILEVAESRGLQWSPASQISERPGEGLSGMVNGRQVLITGSKRAPQDQLKRSAAQTGLGCVVFLEGVFAGTLRFEDSPRKESRRFLEHLLPHHQVTRIMLVSGDREAEVRALASHVGIEVTHAAKTPEEKVEIVRAEATRQKTLFVGDGINDAPAMQAATVGVAFGISSDITSEAADAVVMETSLAKVDELIHIARRMRAIALESAVGGMTLSMAGMTAAALGYLPPMGGAIAQELIDLIVVLNAVRVAVPFRGALQDF